MTSLLLFVAAVAVALALVYARRRRPPPPPPPVASPQQRKLLGLETQGDQRVLIQVRDWSALKLALWRSKVSWEIAGRAAADVVARCAHADGCAGKLAATEPCLPGCPDREVRMSALVVLSAARQFAPVDARKPAEAPYFAPSRERYSEVLAELSSAQAELEALRGSAGDQVVLALERSLRESPTPVEEARPRLESYGDLIAPPVADAESENEGETNEA